MDSVLMLIVVGSCTLAALLSAFAWRALRRERHRSAARVARLQSLSMPSTEAAPAFDLMEDIELPVRPHPAAAPLFEVQGPAPRRAGATVMVVMLFMAIGAGTVYGLYGPSWPSSPAEVAPPTGATKLELVSLTHRRDNDAFVITGLVQNPHPSAATPALTAVVYLFDERGQFLSSAKAAVDGGQVHASDVSPFTIRVTAAGPIARYRVAFRQEDGRAFAHVDRRTEGISGTTLATVETAR